MINIIKIYLVTNCYGDPNKVYIGKTKSSRERAHKLTYGRQIIYAVIDEVNSENHKIWKPLETYWIEQFRHWGFEVLNKNSGGGGPSMHSIETIQRMKEGQLKAKTFKRLRSKHILQYSLEGELIKEWPSITEAKNMGFGGVDMCVVGKTKTAGGYIWRYKSDPLPEHFTLSAHKSCISISQFTSDGKWIKDWDSIKEASISLSMDAGSLTACLKGRQKTAYGFIWKYTK
jgi:hypothetical protein